MVGIGPYYVEVTWRGLMMERLASPASATPHATTSRSSVFLSVSEALLSPLPSKSSMISALNPSS